jgi:lysophospholipase L1-like esterase
VAEHRKTIPPHIARTPVVAELTQRTAGLYAENLEAMAKAATSAGSRFLAVLPPSPFSTDYDHKTDDLEFARAHTEAQMPKLAEVLQSGQAALSETLVKLKAAGIDTLDLSAALKAKIVDVFIDQGHLNATGYGMLADRIAQAVLAPAAASQP